jgi:hypothetical protein
MLKLQKPLKKIGASCMSKQISMTVPLSHNLNRASQEERITILKMAITEKGIIPGSHYELAPISQPLITQPTASHTTTPSSAAPVFDSSIEEDGVYL